MFPAYWEEFFKSEHINPTIKCCYILAAWEVKCGFAATKTEGTTANLILNAAMRSGVRLSMPSCANYCVIYYNNITKENATCYISLRMRQQLTTSITCY